MFNIFAKVISIHAPVWGATGDLQGALQILDISIHAPVWGATQNGRWCTAWNQYFNSRSRVGSDLQVIAHPVTTSLISIHAPVWGATLYPCLWLFISVNFNSRSRVGSDPDWLHKRIRTCYFNSRSRVGSDLGFAIYLGLEILFQFTLPCGERRAELSFIICFIFISIHAPVWGAT